MWKLIRLQAQGWWWRPVLAAFAVGAAAATFEWLYEGRAPTEWRVTFVLMALSSMVVAGLFTNIHCREQRGVLLRLLPVPQAWPAASRVLTPALLHLLGCAVTLVVATAVGAFDGRSGYSIGLLAAMALFLLLHQFELLWIELRPRLKWMPFGRVFYYGLPAVSGGVVGAWFAAQDFAFAGVFDESLLITCLVLCVLFGVATFVLYLRRRDYISKT